MGDWKEIEEAPEGKYILLSFANFSVPLVGRYEDGAFYVGDDDEPLIKQDLFVNGWMPLPKCKEE